MRMTRHAYSREASPYVSSRRRYSDQIQGMYDGGKPKNAYVRSDYFIDETGRCHNPTGQFANQAKCGKQSQVKSPRKTRPVKALAAATTRRNSGSYCRNEYGQFAPKAYCAQSAY